MLRRKLFRTFGRYKAQFISMVLMITLGIGIVVFVLSLVPPSVIWKINMFAFGGLETAFCWVLVFGLFWKRVDQRAALASSIAGIIVAMERGWISRSAGVERLQKDHPGVEIFTAALEPMLIVLVAGVVGFIAISILSAVFKVTSGLGGA